MKFLKGSLQSAGIVAVITYFLLVAAFPAAATLFFITNI